MTRPRPGRLSQLCPACGLVEAAGFYCTSCRTPTGEGHWFANRSHDTRHSAAGAARTGDEAPGGTESHPHDDSNEET